MAPKVGQLSLVSPYHEYRRSGTDFLLPARTGRLVVFAQPKVGQRGVQTFSDDLSPAQLHFVDAARRAAIPDSIPKTVNQKHSQPGKCFERLLAPLQCDVTRRHNDRCKWPSIAMNV